MNLEFSMLTQLYFLFIDECNLYKHSYSYYCSSFEIPCFDIDWSSYDLEEISYVQEKICDSQFDIVLILYFKLVENTGLKKTHSAALKYITRILIHISFLCSIFFLDIFFVS